MGRHIVWRAMIRVTEATNFFKPEWYTTWILKVGLREANAISKKALKIGTRLHEILASGKFDFDKKDTQEVKNCVIAFNKWRERNSIYGSELELIPRITDEVIGVTGEPDVYYSRTKTLIDFKTSSKVSPENFFQLGGYARLVKDHYLNDLAILRLDKETSDFEYVTASRLGLTITACIDAFEATFKHYQYYTHINRQLGGTDERDSDDRKGSQS